MTGPVWGGRNVLPAGGGRTPGPFTTGLPLALAIGPVVDALTGGVVATGAVVACVGAVGLDGVDVVVACVVVWVAGGTGVPVAVVPVVAVDGFSVLAVSGFPAPKSLSFIANATPPPMPTTASAATTIIQVFEPPDAFGFGRGCASDEGGGR